MRLSIKNIGKLSNADINLKGITVIAGGKLTEFNNLANPAKFAQFGGITVYKNTIPAPGIPVYYYEYDPNTNQPTGNVLTETFQPNGNTTAKFKPYI